MVRIGTFPDYGLLVKFFGMLAPRAGLEPATLRLTAECSTIELPRNKANTAEPIVRPKLQFITQPENLRQRGQSSHSAEKEAVYGKFLLPCKPLHPGPAVGPEHLTPEPFAVMGTALKFTAAIERYPPGGEKTLTLSFLLRSFPRTYPSHL